MKKRALTSQQVADGFLLSRIQREPLAQQLLLLRAVAAAPGYARLAQETTKLADKVELLMRERRKTSLAHHFEAVARALAITEDGDL